MKKSIFTFWLLLMLQQFGLSQTMVQEGNLWNYTINCSGFGTSVCFQTNTYKFEGDTLINGNTYKFVWVAQDSLQEEWQPFQPTPLVRETVDKKVYGLIGNEEILYYDFALEIGDIAKMYADEIDGVVVAIDSVELMNGEWRKRWKFDFINFPNEFDYWIEGIGSTTDILEKYYFDTGADLACFHQNEELLLQAADSCFVDILILSNSEMTAKNIQLTVFPNPSNSKTTIDLETDVRLIGDLKIRNLNGQTMAVFKIDSEDNFEISVKNYQSGIYFLQLLTAERIIKTEKFIVQ